MCRKRVYPEASHDRVDAGERPFVGSVGHARASITVKTNWCPGPRGNNARIGSRFCPAACDMN